MSIDFRSKQVHSERHVAHGLAAEMFADCHGQQSCGRWQSKHLSQCVYEEIILYQLYQSVFIAV